MPSRPDALDARIGGLLHRAAAGEAAGGFVDEIESVLSEGYLAALRADADRRARRDPGAAQRAADLRGRLAELRGHYVRLAGLRTDVV